MKLFRTLAAVGAGVFLAKRLKETKYGELFAPPSRTKPVDSSRSRDLPRAGAGTRSSGAAAASGAFRDDRDVAGVGALRDEDLSGR